MCDIDASAYCCFVLRGRCALPDRGDLCYVEHEDHVHVLYRSSISIANLTMDRILSRCLVDVTQRQQVMNSKQLVRNPRALLAYMKSWGKITHVSSTFLDMMPDNAIPWNDCQTIPSETDKMDKIGDLQVYLQDNDICTFQEYDERTSDEKKIDYMIKFGARLRKTLKSLLSMELAGRVKYERETPYHQLCQEELDRYTKRHRCCYNPTMQWLATDWFNEVMKKNELDAHAFVLTIEKIMDMKSNKVNCLVFEGPTNCGKSLFCNLITEFLICGHFIRLPKSSKFAFKNLVDRYVAILEEPKITAAFCEDMKLLLGGDQRMPTIINTTQPIGSRVSQGDADALASRCYTIYLQHKINSTVVDGTIDACPVDLDATIPIPGQSDADIIESSQPLFESQELVEEDDSVEAETIDNIPYAFAKEGEHPKEKKDQITGTIDNVIFHDKTKPEDLKPMNAEELEKYRQESIKLNQQSRNMLEGLEVKLQKMREAGKQNNDNSQLINFLHSELERATRGEELFPNIDNMYLTFAPDLVGNDEAAELWKTSSDDQ
ncbi:hypothetical protein Aperf_G00000116252 [Anoplocephala perfoliata]